MATFGTVIPMADALWNAPEKHMGHKINWQATRGNAMQEMVLATKVDALAMAGELSPEQLMSMAADDAQTVNTFLANNGFGDIQLADVGRDGMLYAASILKLLGEFYEYGMGDYFLENIARRGFRLSKKAKVAHFDYQGLHVVEVPTRANFSLLVSAPHGQTDFVSMQQNWMRVTRGMKAVRGNGVVLPMAVIDSAKIDVTPMKGMIGIESLNYWMIQEALMAAKFALSMRAVKFEAAFAYSAKSFGISRINEPEKGDYIADDDLFFALARRGRLLPLAVGHVPADELSVEDVM